MIDPVEASHMVGLPPTPPPRPTRVGYLLKISREQTRDYNGVDRILAVEDAEHLREAYEDDRMFAMSDVDDGVDRWKVSAHSRSWPPTAEERALLGDVDYVESFEVWNAAGPFPRPPFKRSRRDL